MSMKWEDIKDLPLTEDWFKLVYEVNKEHLKKCSCVFGVTDDEMREATHKEYFIPGMTVEVMVESIKMLLSSIDAGYEFPNAGTAIRNGIEYATIALSCPNYIARVAEEDAG